MAFVSYDVFNQKCFVNYEIVFGSDNNQYDDG